MTRDVIVVGGGVIGCSIAWRLAQAGLKVTVIERGVIGCEASRAAAGMLTPQGETTGPSPFLEMGLSSRTMYRSFADELKETSDIDIEYNDEGTVFVLMDDQSELTQTGWVSWQKQAGLSVEPVTSDDLRKLEPALTKSASRAIFLADEHQIENRRLMDALAVAIRRNGVQLIEGQSVDRIKVERNCAVGVDSGGELLSGKNVIVAAGAWSDRLLEPIGIRLGVKPAKGQMLSVRSTDKTRITRVLHSKKAYLVPRSDGRILVGATVEDRGFNKSVTVEGIRYLLNAAVELIPALEDCQITETWAGVRPDTPDHLPFLGKTNVQNLLLATGHFRNGILLAPITAKWITELIVSRRSPEGLNNFSIERIVS